MNNNPNARRHFAIRASIAKRQKKEEVAQKSVMVFGRPIEVTKDNENMIEFALEIDAQAAYAAASEEAARRQAKQSYAAAA